MWISGKRMFQFQGIARAKVKVGGCLVCSRKREGVSEAGWRQMEVGLRGHTSFEGPGSQGGN